MCALFFFFFLNLSRSKALLLMSSLKENNNNLKTSDGWNRRRNSCPFYILFSLSSLFLVLRFYS